MDSEIKNIASEYVALMDRALELENLHKVNLKSAKAADKKSRQGTAGEKKKARAEAIELTERAVEQRRQADAARAKLADLARTMPAAAVELIRNATVNPYGTNIADQSVKGKFFNFMFTNMKKEYMRRELMVSLVAFVYQMLEEYQTGPEDELRGLLNGNVPSVEQRCTLLGKTEEQLRSANVDMTAKLTTAERKKVEQALEAMDGRRQWVRQFLDNIFEFDPLVHVRGSQLHRRRPGWLSKTRIVRKVNRVDVPRETLRNPDSGAYVIIEKRTNADGDLEEVERVVKDQVIEELVEPRDPEAVANFDAPADQAAGALLARDVPADTFARWRRFEAAQYTGIRRAVQIAYAEKPDLEEAIQVCSVHDDAKKAREWRLREQDRVPCDILEGNLANGWCLLGPFKENLARIDFYNKNTETLKLALEQIEADQKLQRQLMEKRIEREKRTNIEKDGPDAPGLRRKYKAAGDAHVSRSAARPLDGDKISALEKEVEEGGSSSSKPHGKAPANVESEETLDQLLRATQQQFLQGHAVAEAVPDDAVAVDVHMLNARTGQMERAHFLTEAEDSADAKIASGLG